jgi:hypothetical protein
MFINMISSGFPLYEYIALMRYNDMIMVAKSKGSTLTKQLTACSRVHLEDLVLSQLIKNYQHFTKPDDSLLSSQQPNLFPNSGPEQYCPHSVKRVISDIYILILSSHLHLGLTSVPFTSPPPPLQIRSAILPSSICATCRN